MSDVEVLKFGSSVLRTPEDLPVAVDEIYRQWRAGRAVVAVVSAFEGITDRLWEEAASLFGSDCPEATAAYVATGEQKTAALLVGSLRRCGIPARFVDPREIGLDAEKSTLDSSPIRLNRAAVECLWESHSILVIPGFYGIDASGRIALFGRGGSDLSALFLAVELGGRCRLVKNVSGVFDADPICAPGARRFAAMSWETAMEVSGPLIQAKALRYAKSRALSFEVGRSTEDICTIVGDSEDRWGLSKSPSRPLRIVLLGCGVVGRGVYDAIRRYPDRFEISHVVVRDVDRHAGVERLTSDLSVVLEDSIDLVIECFGGLALAFPLMSAALNSGRFVITASKAAVAGHWASLSAFAEGEHRRLWYSAAVGSLPALETLSTLKAPVSEVRGMLSGTCGVVLDAIAEGKSLDRALAIARDFGFTELDSTRDLSGRDSADKLSLIIRAAFGVWVPPESIETRGIGELTRPTAGCKLIARARRSERSIAASVRLEAIAPESFLGQGRGPENRLEIELSTGQVFKLRGQGAGRWPTTVSVLGDLHEVARRIETNLR